ncbi:hypothetical protein [Bacillus sp. BP-3]|uniref:hypothetical protein n=1 Tax=Bacillus sp. BP-3 TaxID=3022773 RepID=UPI002330EBF0|nr:hypothetical protein [Bacillus sp. BP-3]MDC2867529.1 hypothetical protein [Bacillus sp. BP-3]
MIDGQILTSVVLPRWVTEGAQNEFEQLLNARKYINNKRYPGYRIVSITNGIALCEVEVL